MSDLYLLDDDERIAETLAASKDYLAANPQVAADLRGSVQALHILGDLMPQDLDRVFSGHGIPLNESYSELEAAIQLAKRGFYRQAFSTLRVVLELGLLSVYFDIDDESHVAVQPWISGTDRTPSPQKMLVALGKVEPFESYFKTTSFEDDILKQYERLNGFVHVRSAKHSSHALNQTNVRAFHEDSLKAVRYHVRRVSRAIVVAHVLKYPVAFQETPLSNKFGLNPPAGGFLEPAQAELLRAFVGQEVADRLQEISDADEGAVGVGEWVRAMPDITDKEIDKQLLEHDRWLISNSGFEHWTTTSGQFIEGASPEEQREHIRRRALLEGWARENNVMDEAGARKYMERERARLLAEAAARLPEK